jgi:small subunit ribosomal protein S9
MEILARAVGRRKEAVAQVQIIRGTGQFIINDKVAQEYLHNNSCSLLSVKAPFDVVEKTNSASVSVTFGTINNSQFVDSEIISTTKLGDIVPYSLNLETFDTIVKVKGGGLMGQAEAIKLGIARALCNMESMKISVSGIDPSLLNNQEVPEIRKQLKTKGYLTQDSRVKERRKYGLKKARKASQYNKR